MNALAFKEVSSWKIPAARRGGSASRSTPPSSPRSPRSRSPGSCPSWSSSHSWAPWSVRASRSATCATEEGRPGTGAGGSAVLSLVFALGTLFRRPARTRLTFAAPRLGARGSQRHSDSLSRCLNVALPSARHRSEPRDCPRRPGIQVLRRKRPLARRARGYRVVYGPRRCARAVSGRTCGRVATPDTLAQRLRAADRGMRSEAWPAPRHLRCHPTRRGSPRENAVAALAARIPEHRFHRREDHSELGLPRGGPPRREAPSRGGRAPGDDPEHRGGGKLQALHRRRVGHVGSERRLASEHLPVASSTPSSRGSWPGRFWLRLQVSSGLCADILKKSRLTAAAAAVLIAGAGFGCRRSCTSPGPMPRRMERIGPSPSSPTAFPEPGSLSGAGWLPWTKFRGRSSVEHARSPPAVVHRRVSSTW